MGGVAGRGPPAAGSLLRGQSAFANFTFHVLKIRARVPLGLGTRLSRDYAQKQIQDKGWAHPAKVSSGVGHYSCRLFLPSWAASHLGSGSWLCDRRQVICFWGSNSPSEDEQRLPHQYCSWLSKVMMIRGHLTSPG